MKRKRIYSYKAVDNYIANNDLIECVDIVPGVLVDSYFIYHNNAIEVFEEYPLNSWESGLIRHIYRKGLPKRLQALHDTIYEVER